MLLTVFGVFAVSAIVLAFAVACLLASAYGFLQGAWPFGVVELVWSAVALDRWRRRLKPV